jgi:FMN reductase
MAIRVLGVNGSLRPRSTADRALRFTLRMLEGHGAQCDAFEIAALPVFDGRPDDQYPASVSAWRAACSAADGFVITVPSFHGGMPGGLKNALDFVDMPHVGGKPFVIVGIAGGDGEPGASDTARVMRYIGGIAAQPDVIISRSAEHWGPGDEPRNESVAVAIRKVMADLAALCELRVAGRLPRP